jgi:hypothetical protein
LTPVCQIFSIIEIQSKLNRSHRIVLHK